jgi:hypothetical protein
MRVPPVPHLLACGKPARFFAAFNPPLCHFFFWHPLAGFCTAMPPPRGRPTFTFSHQLNLHKPPQLSPFFICTSARPPHLHLLSPFFICKSAGEGVGQDHEGEVPAGGAGERRRRRRT